VAELQLFDPEREMAIGAVLPAVKNVQLAGKKEWEVRSLLELIKPNIVPLIYLSISPCVGE
jgi:hypothetical protein